MIIEMRNVGHGLKVIINKNLMVDCGSTNLTRYINEFTNCNYHDNITTFMLSHFHYDHYNGIEKLPSLANVSKVYLPGIPNYSNDPTVFIDLYALMLSISSIITHKLALFDLLLKFKNKSSSPSVFVELLYNNRRAEQLVIGNTEEYDILWPPRNLDNNHVLAKLARKLVTYFNNNLMVKEYTTILQPIFKQILVDLVNGVNILTENYYNKIDYTSLKRYVTNLNITTFHELEKINNVLARAGDKLSLAFNARENDKILLFFSDQDSSRIKNVINELGIITLPYNVNILIPPHHGTRWHSEMLKLQAKDCIISCSKSQSLQTYYKFSNLRQITTNVPEETYRRNIFKRI